MLILVARYAGPFYDPMDFSTIDSSTHEISQARILEQLAIPFSRGSSQPRGQTQVSCITGRFFIIEPPKKSPINVYTTKINGTYETVHWDVWINVVDEVRMSQYGCDRGSLKKKMSKEFLRKDLKSNYHQLMKGLQLDRK